MTTTPPPIIKNARITQELTIDKDGLADWMRRFFESVQYTSFCTKTEIEPHVVKYSYDYGKMAETLDFLYTHAIAEAQRGPGNIFSVAKDIYVTGEGEKACAHAIYDLDALLKPTPIKSHVTGLMRDENIPSNTDALASMASAFQITGTGLKVDGQKLLAGLQGALNLPGMDNPMLTLDERKHLLGSKLQLLNSYIDKILPNAKIRVDKGTLAFDIPVRSMIEIYPRMASLIGAESAVRMGASDQKEANLIIDFRHLVDIAGERAKAILEGKESVRIRDVDPHTVTVLLSKGGMEGMLNQLIETGTQKLLKANAAAMPAEVLHLGRLGDNDQKLSPGG